ncbi:hypothetical protein Pmani_038932 [Petrolisthes manimaculis]|uniref:Uncharacterized protein n=1 Tax=Petrolisthes manimaculis TaxID=1843537 RepID=A0AAE1NFY5_9EUCA|nr:hypothetical protein Pmani_038932 [Petrolisthes manimaculis]
MLESSRSNKEKEKEEEARVGVGVKEAVMNGSIQTNTTTPANTTTADNTTIPTTPTTAFDTTNSPSPSCTSFSYQVLTNKTTDSTPSTPSTATTFAGHSTPSTPSSSSTGGGGVGAVNLSSLPTTPSTATPTSQNGPYPNGPFQYSVPQNGPQQNQPTTPNSPQPLQQNGPLMNGPPPLQQNGPLPNGHPLNNGSSPSYSDTAFPYDYDLSDPSTVPYHVATMNVDPGSLPNTNTNTNTPTLAARRLGHVPPHRPTTHSQPQDPQDPQDPTKTQKVPLHPSAECTSVPRGSVSITHQDSCTSPTQDFQPITHDHPRGTVLLILCSLSLATVSCPILLVVNQW